MQKKVITMIAFFIVIVLAVTVFVILKQNKELVPQEKIYQNTLEVSDQKAGNSISISKASFAFPGFVVLFSDNNGKPGSILGKSQLLPKGEAEKFNVYIIGTRSVSGQVLYTYLYKDNGDGVFNINTDKVALNVSGQPVFVKFSILKDSEPIKNTSGVLEIKIKSGDMFFDPKKITTKKDQKIKLIFDNQGTHSFTINEFGIDVPLRKSSVTFEFTPTKAGIFEFYSSYENQKAQGMKGLLEVLE